MLSYFDYQLPQIYQQIKSLDLNQQESIDSLINKSKIYNRFVIKQSAPQLQNKGRMQKENDVVSERLIASLAIVDQMERVQIMSIQECKEKIAFLKIRLKHQLDANKILSQELAAFKEEKRNLNEDSIIMPGQNKLEEAISEKDQIIRQYVSSERMLEREIQRLHQVIADLKEKQLDKPYSDVVQVKEVQGVSSIIDKLNPNQAEQQQEENKFLEEKLKKAEAMYEREISRLTNSLNEETNRSLRLDEEIERFRAEVSRLQAQSIDSSNIYEQEITRLHHHNQNLTRENQRLTQIQLQPNTNSNHSLEQIAKLKAELSHNEDRLNQAEEFYEKEITRNNRKCEDYEQTIQKLHDVLNDMEAKKEKYKDRVRSLETPSAENTISLFRKAMSSLGAQEKSQLKINLKTLLDRS